MDTGDPVTGGAFLKRIGYFQARARQLTSKAFGWKIMDHGGRKTGYWNMIIAIAS